MSRIDVKKLRQDLKMTQEEFAAKFKFSVGAVRDWEQGRCDPTEAAQTLLTIIARAPDAVLQAVKVA